jgi:hypothetical protein
MSPRIAKSSLMSKHLLVYTTTLVSHPEASSQAVHSLEVCASLHPEYARALTFTYTLTGDRGRIKIPSPQPSAKVDGLWRHTCFEAFLSGKGDSTYWEFNFSPSGEWARYHFSSYRNSSPLEEGDPAPQITTWRMTHGVKVDASIHLPRSLTAQPLRIALSAVIEEQNGLLSYWALRHPPGKPDFHHSDAFALEIDSPNVQPMKEHTR